VWAETSRSAVLEAMHEEIIGYQYLGSFEVFVHLCDASIVWALKLYLAKPEIRISLSGNSTLSLAVYTTTFLLYYIRQIKKRSKNEEAPIEVDSRLLTHPDKR
jgi:hypothetical protein